MPNRQSLISGTLFENALGMIHSPYAGMANVGGLEGCKPSKDTSFSRAAEAVPPPRGKGGFRGGRVPFGRLPKPLHCLR
jgi:hypothetical protein